MRIVFTSGKGGAGKSTLCFGTALALAQAGKSVAVEDLDPQRSIAGWIDTERDGLEDSPEKAAIIVVDTPPRLDDPSVIAAISQADVVVVPVTPSPADIGAGKATVEVVNKYLRSEARSLAVINQTKQGTSLTNAVHEVVGLLGLPVATVTIPSKQCIQRAVMGGWTTFDTKSRESFLRLALELVT